MFSSKILKAIFNPIEFTDLTGIIFLVHAISCLVTFAILGESPYINVTSLSLIVVIDIAFFFSLRGSTERTAAHLLAYSWFVLLFFNIRLFALLVFPPEALEFPTGLIVTISNSSNEEISTGLVFVAGGILAVLAGIHYASRLLKIKQTSPDINSKNFSLWTLTGYWAMAYAASYYVTVHLGVSIYKSPDNWGNRMAWIRIIFDTDIALMYTIIWTFIQRKYFQITSTQKLHVSLLVFCWLVFSVMAGSRGGPFRILIFIFICALAITPKFKISVASMTALIGTTFFINLFAFSLGTAIRHAEIGNISVSKSIESDAVRHKSFKNSPPFVKQSNISNFRMVFYNVDQVREIAFILRPIITRLALIDYPLTIVTHEGNKTIVDDYIRSLYPIKNFINSLFPGELFKEATINTSRVFGMIYLGKTHTDITENYISEPFTLWGLAWLIAGFLGIPLMFGVAVFIQVGFNFIEKRPSIDRISLRFVYIMIGILGIYGVYGLDSWLTSAAHFSLASFIAFVFIRFFSLAKPRG